MVRLATWMEACIWLAIFIVPNTFQSVAYSCLFLVFPKCILAQFEGVTLFWLGDQRAKLYGKIRKWDQLDLL